MDWQEIVISNILELPPVEDWTPPTEDNPECEILEGLAIKVGDIGNVMAYLETQGSLYNDISHLIKAAPIIDRGVIDELP